MADQDEAVGSQETLLEMLRRLPPSKELLDFYHGKVEDFAAEEKKWLDRLSNSRVLTNQIQKLDKELSNQKREIAALQKARRVTLDFESEGLLNCSSGVYVRMT